MYYCKVIFELGPVIKLSINYYVDDKLIYTFLLIESHTKELDSRYPDSWSYWDIWGTSSYTEKNLTLLTNAMKNNTTFDNGCIGMSWYNNIYKNIPFEQAGFNYTEFKLTNDERLQFIEELDMLNQMLSLIYCKMRICESIHTLIK